MTPDPNEIATRHGIPHLADQLTGDTADALEADAAARAAIIELLGGTLNFTPTEKPEPAEPEPDEDESEWTDERLKQLVERTQANKQRQQQAQGEEPEPSTINDLIDLHASQRKEWKRQIIERAHGNESDES